MKAINELAGVVKGHSELIQKSIDNEADMLGLIRELAEAVKKLEQFRVSNPDVYKRLTENETDKLAFKCPGFVQGYGPADLFEYGGRTLFCLQPGIARPLDGNACYNTPGTNFWDCGSGQILFECWHCGCATPTAAPPTGVPPTNTNVVPPTATANPPTGVPPTLTPPPTAIPPTGEPPTATRPLPTNAPTPEGTKECKCLDVKIDFAYEAKVEPKVWGTTVTKNGNGYEVFLGGVFDSFMETSWDDCQYFVGNAYQLDKDWGNPSQGPVTECVVFYHRGAGAIKINVTDGIIFHNDENKTGYNINESLAQMRDTLERGGYGCTLDKIKYVELKSFK